MSEYSPDWRARSACRTLDPDLFFPVAVGGAVASTQIAKAQRVCARCPVSEQCLDFAMQTGEPTGIWGGTTPEERIRALRARRRPSRRPRQDAPAARAS